MYIEVEDRGICRYTWEKWMYDMSEIVVTDYKDDNFNLFLEENGIP